MVPELEKRLVERARDGDMAAWERLYRAHKDALYHRVIRPRTRSEADAEDVLVDTFTTALQRLDQFEWRGYGLFSWLARIAANKAHDLGRRAQRDDRRVAALSAHPDPSPPLPDEELERRRSAEEAKRQVEAALEGINPRYARALRLRLLEDRPRVECAQAMDVKLGTFDVLMLRATRAFRKAWHALYGDLQ